MRRIVATTLLLISTPAMAGTYIAPPIHVAPVVHVAPIVRVAPVVRVNPVVKPVTTTTTTVRPVVHPHHPRPQPVIVYSAAQKPKCVEQKPGAKECAKK